MLTQRPPVVLRADPGRIGAAPAARSYLETFQVSRARRGGIRLAGLAQKPVESRLKLPVRGSLAAIDVPPVVKQLLTNERGEVLPC